MTKVVLSGAAGRMGRMIAETAQSKSDRYEIVAGIDSFKGKSETTFTIVSSPSELAVEADVVIDFSNPSSLDALLAYVIPRKMPIALCTTGFNEEQVEKIKQASKQTAVFFSFNMSLGINLLAELAQKASLVLGEDYDIEILDKHHNQKIDAPSGTALILADAINEANDNKFEYVYDRSQKHVARSKHEIGIQAIRGGSIIGEHDVIFAGQGEAITLSHVVYSREVFANGALKAAEFIKDKPIGLYSMKDMI